MNRSTKLRKRSVAFVLIVIMIFSFSISTFAEEAESKEEIYTQYQEIVSKVNSDTVKGLPLSLKAYDKMEEGDWVNTEEFEEAAYALANAEFELTDGSSDLLSARLSGSTAKTMTSTEEQASFEVIISGSFNTQYNTAIRRQVFMHCNSVTSESNTEGFVWSQIDYYPQRLDSGRTYQINVSGSISYYGLIRNHIFSVEYYCNSNGAVS